MCEVGPGHSVLTPFALPRMRTAGEQVLVQQHETGYLPRETRNRATVGSMDRLEERCHAFASNTRLNGVCVARRNRVSPPFMTTSRSRASPA